MSIPRWVCPHCRSNNMPQSAACFRCGSLPPTLAAQPTIHLPLQDQRTLAIPKRKTKGPPAWIIIVGCIGVVIYAVLLKSVFGGAAGPSGPAPLLLPPSKSAEVTWYSNEAPTGAWGELRNTGSEPLNGLSVQWDGERITGSDGFTTGTRPSHLQAVWGMGADPNPHALTLDEVLHPKPPEGPPTIAPGDARSFYFYCILPSAIPENITVRDASGNEIPTNQVTWRTVR